MKTKLTILALALTALTTGSVMAAPAANGDARPTSATVETDDSARRDLIEARRTATEILGTALRSIDRLGDGADDDADAARIEQIRAANERALAALDGKSRLAIRLREAMNLQPSGALQTLESVFAALTFRVVREADVPVGFPEPTLVGEIEIKQYPTYRLARAKMNGLMRENRAFWTLFQHIQSNEIAMTAPVEMTYKDGKASDETMAFLYGSTDIGETGDLGKVEVIDVAPMMVVSIGLRGDRRNSRVDGAEEALRAWLAENPEYRVNGDLRVFGYNGPSVRGNRRFFEVQIPIERVEPAPAPVVERWL